MKKKAAPKKVTKSAKLAKPHTIKVTQFSRSVPHVVPEKAKKLAPKKAVKPAIKKAAPPKKVAAKRVDPEIPPVRKQPAVEPCITVQARGVCPAPPTD